MSTASEPNDVALTVPALAPPTPESSNPATPTTRSRQISSESLEGQDIPTPRASTVTGSRPKGTCGRRTIFALLLCALLALGYMAYTSYEAFGSEPELEAAGTAPQGSSSNVYYTSEEEEALTAEETQGYAYYWEWLYKKGCADEEIKQMIEELGGLTKASGFARRVANSMAKGERAKWRQTAVDETTRLVVQELDMLGLDVNGAKNYDLRLSSPTTAAFCSSLQKLVYAVAHKRKALPEPKPESQSEIHRLIKDANSPRPSEAFMVPAPDKLEDEQLKRLGLMNEDKLQDEAFAQFMLPDMRALLHERSLRFEWDMKQQRPNNDVEKMLTEPISCVRTWLDDRGNERQYKPDQRLDPDGTLIDYAWKGIGPKGQTCLFTAVGQDLVGAIRFPETGKVVNVRSLGNKHFAFFNSRQDMLWDIREATEFGGASKLQGITLKESLELFRPDVLEWDLSPLLPEYIDVYFGYTPDLEAWRPDIDAYFQWLLDLANDSYRDSGIRARLRHYGQRSLRQDSTSTSECTDRDRARDKGDGFWNELDNVRLFNSATNTWYGPDVIAVTTGSTDYCGCAYIHATDVDTEGYISMGRSCASDVGGFPHEIGHLFGARHNPEKDSTSTPYEYGHGWLEDCNGRDRGSITLKRTIMSYRASSSGYTCGTASITESMTGLWSDPGRVFDGDNIGSVQFEDAQRVHNERRVAMAELADDGCFPAEASVETAQGDRIPMSELRVGDEVLAVMADGSIGTSPVVAFLDKQTSTPAALDAGFLQLQLAEGRSLTLTPEHLVFKVDRDANTREGPLDFASAAIAVKAQHVQAGDALWLLGAGASGVEPSLVVEVLPVRSQGLYAPLVASGKLIVDGVVASCYSHAESHDLAHLAMAPLRWFGRCSYYLWQQDEGENVGIHPFARFLDRVVPDFVRRSPASFLRQKSSGLSTTAAALLLMGCAVGYSTVRSKQRR